MITYLPMDTQKILEEMKKEISRLQKAVDALEEGNGGSTTKRKRKPMSQAARDKIAAAQKKRWAKAKG